MFNYFNPSIYNLEIFPLMSIRFNELAQNRNFCQQIYMVAFKFNIINLYYTVSKQ